MNVNKFFVTIVGLIYLLSIQHEAIYAQSKKISYKKWEAEMQAEEKKIQTFTEEKIRNADLSRIVPHVNFESCVTRHYTAEDSNNIIKAYLTTQFRQDYFKRYPGAHKIYDPNRVVFNNSKKNSLSNGSSDVTTITNCLNGDFESGSLSGYSLHGQNLIYTGGSCSLIPNTGVSYPTVPYLPDNFLITTNGPDPLIPALSRTYNNSSRALRINAPTPCLTQQSINLLRKQITVAAGGPHELTFYFALVMQQQHETNGNPFFLARLINSSNTEVGNRICYAPGSDAFFQTTTINRGCYNNEPAVWRDWDCATIAFNATAGETYTLEIFVADCGVLSGAHFGYAYVDNICARQCCGLQSDVSCCDVPVNLDCHLNEAGEKILTWDAVPTATNYMVEIIEGDPACCDSMPPGAQAIMFGPVTTNSFTVPGNVAGCFSWRIHANCEHSVISSQSRQYCSSCVDCPFPDSLDCIANEDGTRYLTWALSANAISYQVGIIEGDPACCDSIPSGAQSILFAPVTTNIFEVPNTVQDCFSWTVRAKCEDNNYSDWAPYKCSCLYCGNPEGLDCEETTNGNLLSWNAVPNVAYYIIELYKNDPDCCPNASFGTVYLMTSTTNNILIPFTQASCFSWKVQAVCQNGGYSEYAEQSSCSCAQPICYPPEELTCEYQDYLSHLSWSVVPGAVYYKVNVTLNDPACCSIPGPLTTQTYDVTANDVIFFNLQGECFSWNVQAVCTDSTVSVPSANSCSCNMIFSDGRIAPGQQATSEEKCLKVSPNPASSYIDFTLNAGSRGCLQYLSSVIYIYDNRGLEIQKITIDEANPYRLNTAAFKAGIYTYKVIQDKNLLDSGKFTIVK